MTPSDHPSDPHGTPDGADDAAQLRFAARLCTSEAFDAFLARERTEEVQRQQLLAQPNLAYRPQPGAMSACGNGLLEPALDTTQWQAAHGPRPAPLQLAQPFPFQGLTAGFLSGTGVHNPMAKHSWVAPGADPIASGLNLTAPQSAGAVRLGNAGAGDTCTVLSKTFVVSPERPLMSFWYALVMQDCGHGEQRAPFFWVRVSDASGQLVAGAVDLGQGADRFVDVAAHPMFHAVPSAGMPTFFKDWSCAQIDLSSQLGRQVTVEFVVADCKAAKAWAYAYIDSLCTSCAGSPSGSLQYACEASSHCGPGQLCFDYTLPYRIQPDGTTLTGEVQISLALIQNGVVVHTLSSGLLSRGERFCFAIDPAQLPGVNPALGGFDVRATAQFSIGGFMLGSMVVGTPQEGVGRGRNNDYLLRCASCDELSRRQAAWLQRRRDARHKHLARAHCHCPPGADCACGGGCGGCGGAPDPHHAVALAPGNDAARTEAEAPQLKPGCDERGHCRCQTVTWPRIEPCISVAWGDSDCDHIESTDHEVLSVTVCNCHANLSFSNLVIHQIRVVDEHGFDVGQLPDGSASIEVVPSGPICFGDIGPCHSADQPSCVTREIALNLRGAAARGYRLSFSGICFDVVHHVQTEQCFVLPVCAS